jgi:hypothetical protein
MPSGDRMWRVWESKWAVGCSDAPLAIGRDARPCQRGVLFAALGVGAAEWSSHAGA